MLKTMGGNVHVQLMIEKIGNLSSKGDEILASPPPLNVKLTPG